MQQIVAKYFTPESDKAVRCLLCPHECHILPGKRGICRVRKNIEGILYSENYGLAVGMGLDPIEKKPLYHFQPGKKILSIGTPGCNLKCFYCQNCSISQVGIETFADSRKYFPDELLKMAGNAAKNAGIAFTYNEPVVYYEYMLDTARLFKMHSLKTVMVSNGYINQEPLKELIPFIDAFNIDLKAFDDEFYRINTHSSLAPVLKTLKTIADHKKHLEISFLVIPGLNDDQNKFREMLDWLKNNLSENCVLHISRYFPRYRADIDSTPVELLEKLYDIASGYLQHVYLGNIRESKGKNTYCPVCEGLCIVRNLNNVYNYLTSDGKCPDCGAQVINI